MEASTVTTRPQPKLHSLVHFEIPASDPATVSKFYEQLFDWKFSKWGEQEYWLIAHKDAPANETVGGLFKRNAPNEQFLNYFSVNSIDESAAKATSLGAQVCSSQRPRRKHLRPVPVHRRNVARKIYSTKNPLFFRFSQKTPRIMQAPESVLKTPQKHPILTNIPRHFSFTECNLRVACHN
jgi:predicted enzyme related to lactoylglutathione lyase